MTKFAPAGRKRRTPVIIVGAIVAVAAGIAVALSGRRNSTAAPPPVVVADTERRPAVSPPNMDPAVPTPVSPVIPSDTGPRREAPDTSADAIERARRIVDDTALAAARRAAAAATLSDAALTTGGRADALRWMRRARDLDPSREEYATRLRQLERSEDGS